MLKKHFGGHDVEELRSACEPVRTFTKVVRNELKYLTKEELDEHLEDVLAEMSRRPFCLVSYIPTLSDGNTGI